MVPLRGAPTDIGLSVPESPKDNVPMAVILLLTGYATRSTIGQAHIVACRNSIASKS